MYIEKSWKRVYKSMLIWLVFTVVAAIMIFGLGDSAFVGCFVRDDYYSTILMIALVCMAATSVILLLFDVAPKYKNVVDLITQASDDALVIYGDPHSRHVALEPLIRRKRKLDEADYELREDGWVLKIQHLEVRFRCNDVNGRVESICILHVPSGDQFESRLTARGPEKYYLVLWGEFVVGTMSSQTIEALWHLADEPFDYCRFRNGH